MTAKSAPPKAGASSSGAGKAPPRLHAARTANEKPEISIPQARRIAVDTTGAQIVQEESPAVRPLLPRVALLVTLASMQA